jgi:hypothetical protein
MIYGKDPITKETIEINEWLSENDDNILLIIDKSIKNVSLSRSESEKKNKLNEKIYLFKRSYLQVPEIKHIYFKCILEEGQLMVKDTFKSKVNFYNLGYYLGKNILLYLNEIKAKNINKNNIFKLELVSPNIDEFINKEALLMSQISLSSKNLLKIPSGSSQYEKFKFNYDLKKNLPYKKDVYFEEILGKALTNYSYQWDVPINLYLRIGESYFDTTIFKQYYRRYGKTIEESIGAIKQKVLDLDRAFLEAAPRNEDNTTIYFRGMQRPFEKLNRIGDKETIRNFISITSSFNIALRFSGVLTGAKCCLYKLIIDKGIPFVDMISTTKFKVEKEILLPRNLIFELINVELIEVGIHKTTLPIGVIKVHLQNKDQFKLTSGCKKFNIAKIIPYKPAYIVDNKIKEKKAIAKNNDNKPLVIDPKLQDIMETHKVPLVGKRCPKGYRIHKPTNMCEFVHKTSNSGTKATKTTKTTKTTKATNPEKKPKCKNGTRRNPKTGNCEKK